MITDRPVRWGIRRRRVRGVAVAFMSTAVAVTLAGCGADSGGDSSGGGGTLTVAVIADLTGPQTALGLGSPGIQAAVDKLNKDGGINGQRVKIAGPFDAQSTADGGGAAAQKALAANPDLVIESTSSAGTAATLPVFQNSDIPVIDLSGPAEAVKPTIPLHYSLNMEAGQYATLLLESAHSLADVPASEPVKVAIVGLASPAIDGYITGMKSAASALNADITSVVRTEITQTSFSSQAAALAKEAPDAILLIDSVSGTILEAKALDTAGFKGQIIAAHGASQESTFAKIALPNYSALRLAPVAAEDSDLLVSAKSEGVEKEAADTSYFALGWTAIYTGAAILEKCGDHCSPHGFQKAAEGMGPIKVPGDATYGPIEFGPDKHFGLTAVQMFRWDGSKPAAVGDPTELK